MREPPIRLHARKNKWEASAGRGVDNAICLKVKVESRMPEAHNNVQSVMPEKLLHSQSLVISPRSEYFHESKLFAITLNENNPTKKIKYRIKQSASSGFTWMIVFEMTLCFVIPLARHVNNRTLKRPCFGRTLKRVAYC